MGTGFKAILPVGFKLSPVFSPSANQSQHQQLVGESIDCLKKLACSARAAHAPFRIIQQEVVIEYTLESCGFLYYKSNIRVL